MRWRFDLRSLAHCLPVLSTALHDLTELSCWEYYVFFINSITVTFYRQRLPHVPRAVGGSLYRELPLGHRLWPQTKNSVKRGWRIPLPCKLMEIRSPNLFACVPERYPPCYTSCRNWVDLCIMYCNCFVFSEVCHKISHWFEFLLTSATCLLIIDSFIHSFIIIFWIMNIWRWWGIV